MKRRVPLAWRVWLAGIVVVVAVPFTGVTSTGLGLGKRDLALYWSSGQLAARRTNPYDLAALAKLESSLGQAKPNVPREPPWFLWVLLPLRWLSPAQAWAAWLLLSLAALKFSRIRTSDAVMFAPVLACLMTSQFGFLLLVGWVAFSRCMASGRHLAAGASLLLLAVKPHLFLPFWAVLLVWSFGRRQFRVLAGLAAALIAASAVAVLLDPDVFVDWAKAQVADPVQHLFVPSIPGVVRALARLPFWAQLVPSIFGVAWGVWFFQTRRGWDWAKHGPSLLLAGFVVAPYEWLTDEVVLLPAIGKPGLVAGMLSLVLLLMVAAGVPMASGLYFWSPLVWLAMRSRQQSLAEG